MREILFRGKRKQDGAWVYGYIVPITINCYDKGIEIIDEEGIDYDELDGYNPVFGADRVDPETVGQFTGLTDRNGTKIFEGDIIESPVKRIGKLGTRIIVVDIRTNQSIVWYATEYTVIGNIHDNPELLKVTDHG